VFIAFATLVFSMPRSFSFNIIRTFKILVETGTVVHRSTHLHTKLVRGILHTRIIDPFQAKYIGDWSANCALFPRFNLNVELEPPCSSLFNQLVFEKHLGNPVFCGPSSCTFWASKLEPNWGVKYRTVSHSQISILYQVYLFFRIDS